MKKVVCAGLTAAVMLSILSGCGAGTGDWMDQGNSHTSASPTAFASPLITTPDPDNGRIEDGNGVENGTEGRPTISPKASPSPVPTFGSSN